MHCCDLLFISSRNISIQFISTHGGSSNAYTSAYNTNYYFSINPSFLEPALHRFSTFFISPLFSASCTNRELNAVDSEHKKNHQSDNWRMFQLSKELSRPDHPWRKFGSGNRTSLLAVGKAAEESAKRETPAIDAAGSCAIGENANPQPADATKVEEVTEEEDGGPAGRETRKRLVQWYEQEYCASRMKLVILGKGVLETRRAAQKISDASVRIRRRVKRHCCKPFLGGVKPVPASRGTNSRITFWTRTAWSKLCDLKIPYLTPSDSSAFRPLCMPKQSWTRMRWK